MPPTDLRSSRVWPEWARWMEVAPADGYWPNAGLLNPYHRYSKKQKEVTTIFYDDFKLKNIFGLQISFI